jgi:hypothetical protein
MQSKIQGIFSGGGEMNICMHGTWFVADMDLLWNDLREELTASHSSSKTDTSAQAEIKNNHDGLNNQRINLPANLELGGQEKTVRKWGIGTRILHH